MPKKQNKNKIKMFLADVKLMLAEGRNVRITQMAKEHNVTCIHYDDVVRLAKMPLNEGVEEYMSLAYNFGHKDRIKVNQSTEQQQELAFGLTIEEQKQLSNILKKLIQL